MASRKIESWSQQWRAAGYRNEPDVPVTRSADELLEEDRNEVQLSKDTDVETISTGSSRVGHHDNHPRTTSASWGPSGTLKIVFSHGVRFYSGISEEQWASFKSASEAGSVGPWIDANLR